jgi:aconitate hydratase
MAGEPFYCAMPSVVLVRLEGTLPPWVSAKDIILEVLRRYGVKWGKGKVIEYGGPALKSLTVPDRATITNMGTELGLTSSVFPSDEQTKRFFSAQKRAAQCKALAADRGAAYSDTVDINLGALEPLIALPHSPGNVKTVREAAGRPVQQVCIGSCTNSSLEDMLKVAAMLKGRRVPPHVALTVSPGSRQVLRMMAKSGALDSMLAAGARILENTCGPCIGMGQAPPSGSVSLRTFNRNFKGRSGTPDAEVYLCSPAVAAASAIKGEICDPRDLGVPPAIRRPAGYLIDDDMIVPPPRQRKRAAVIKGPNIKPLPRFPSLEDSFETSVLLLCGDNISTDDIMPAGAKILPLRSNIPALSEHVFERLDPDFARRAKETGGGVIVAGENYGQGSSREHAALAPRYLGVRAVIARSFARIHQANLINFGIMPCVLENPDDYHSLRAGDHLVFEGLRSAAKEGGKIVVHNRTLKKSFAVRLNVSAREGRILSAGGLLNLIRKG